MGMKQDPPSFPRMHLRRRTKKIAALTELCTRSRVPTEIFAIYPGSPEGKLSPGRFRRICDLHTGLAKSNIRSGVRFRECL